ncbi:MAG: TAXI family TRAP transporter solute-binding subunit [Desulfoplanes sp.]
MLARTSSNKGLRFISIAVMLMLIAPALLHAATRITFKSAKSTSSYYQMAVQIGEALKKGSQGDILVTLEESQGSVQNVKEMAHRQGNYVFTTPPGLVKLAKKGAKMFRDANPKYQDIRGLFIIPSLTMHMVVRKDSGIKTFADLEGKKFLIGKGSFGAREAEKYLELFGLKGKVDLVGVELNAAVQAMQNGKIDGFATSGSYPAPNVIEAAAGVDIDLLSFSDEQIALTKRTRLVIPANTYAGVDHDVTTTSLPVGVYTSTAMDNETAYQITKTFWEQKDIMGKANPWWDAVTFASIEALSIPLHPGAARYYKEMDVTIPATLQ